jgi:hypothetical protein
MRNGAPSCRHDGRKLRSARRAAAGPFNYRGDTMLYTVAVVLLILWALGLVTSYTLGGLVHVLLVIAVVVILIRLISGRKPI